MIKITCVVNDGFDRVFWSKVERYFLTEELQLSISYVNDIDPEDNSLFVILDSKHALANEPEAMKKYFKNKNLILFAHPNIEQKNLEILSKEKFVKYICFSSIQFELHIPPLRTIFALKKLDQSSSTLGDVAKKLNNFLSDNLGQIEKLKKIHRKLVKFRSETIRPFELQGRYSPGTASGGEFYDILKSESYFCIVLTSSSNYETSSKVISLIQKSKSLKLSNSNFEKETDNLASSLIKISETDLDFGFLVLSADISRATINIRAKGNFVLFSNRSLNDHNKNAIILNSISVEQFQLTPQRGDKLIICSPGIYKNAVNKTFEGKTFLDFFVAKVDLNQKDFINEVFFQLKNISENSFLEYDSTLITFEIDKNAILKV